MTVLGRVWMLSVVEGEVSLCTLCCFFFFSSRRRHTRCSRDWSSDVCSSDLAKVKGEVPWVVYRVNEGTSAPTFLVFLPLSDLKEYDDLLEQREEILQENEGEDIAERLRQTAREAYASIESNLYVVHPETSHVPKDFAASEADF